MCIRHAPPTPKRALPIAMIEPALLARLMPCASRAPRVGPRSRRARARAVPEAPIARPAHEERARALRAPARQEQLHGWSAPRNWTHARASCDTAMSGVRRIHGTPGSTARYIRAVSSSGSPRPLRLSRTRPPETDDHPAPHEIANPRISTIASTTHLPAEHGGITVLDTPPATSSTGPVPVLVSGRRLYGGRGHRREKPAGWAMASRREPLTQSARNLVPIPHPQRAPTPSNGWFMETPTFRSGNRGAVYPDCRSQVGSRGRHENGVIELVHSAHIDALAG